MNTNDSLKKCSRCKCTILLEYFSKNRKGDYFKCCDNCKKKHSKPSKISPSELMMPMCRLEFIQHVKNTSDEVIEWVGYVNPDEIDKTRFKPEIIEKDHYIEYHKFNVIGTDKTFICRWRPKFVNGIETPIHIHTYYA